MIVKKFTRKEKIKHFENALKDMKNEKHSFICHALFQSAYDPNGFEYEPDIWDSIVDKGNNPCFYVFESFPEVWEKRNKEYVSLYDDVWTSRESDSLLEHEERIQILEEIIKELKRKILN